MAPNLFRNCIISENRYSISSGTAPTFWILATKKTAAQIVNLIKAKTSKESLNALRKNKRSKS